MIPKDKQHQLAYLINLLKHVGPITTERDLSLTNLFMLSSLGPLKCLPFSRESVLKFGTQFLIQLKRLSDRLFVKK